ncbi:MAG: glutamine-hydrolyzing GMP synthase, partial [Candidatus Bathyarchaeia archaeon]
GMTILRNFAVDICGCSPTWTAESFIERAIGDIKAAVGEDRVLCAISGGVDSTTAAVLTHRAVGGQLVCIFVDHGLLRKNEAASVLNVLREDFKMNVTAVDAAARFLRKLKGVGDPERKRRIIGAEFIRVFAEVGKKSGSYQWLVQGTLYPDVIESAKTGSVASRIKTHHNVAGLPGWMKFNLLEPLRWLYKDEVRKVAALLGLPAEIVRRHPFPGPGLAVRVMGEITKEKLRIARDASHIVEEELQRSGWHDKVWQAFAMVGDDKAVGILGDERKYGYVVTIRVVESADAMTADWVKLPPSLIERMSNRITNEVEGVTWVTYAVSSKPPATIEPC